MWIDPWMYLIWAVMILMVPAGWLLSAGCAAMVHEGCHLLMIYFLGKSAEGISIRPGGLEIRTGELDLWEELLCALAGPAGSFSLVLLCNAWPEAAICGVIQGCFNMLPVYPLDGGRALRCCVYLLFPAIADKLFIILDSLAKAFIILITASLGWYLHMELMAVSIIAVVSIRLLMRKKPCKHCRFNVQ